MGFCKTTALSRIPWCRCDSQIGSIGDGKAAMNRRTPKGSIGRGKAAMNRRIPKGSIGDGKAAMNRRTPKGTLPRLEGDL